MVRYINHKLVRDSCKRWDLSEFIVFSYPGINSAKLNDVLRTEVLPPPDNISLIIIHVGTNDASVSRGERSPKEICDSIIQVMKYIREIYPSARVQFSNILKRFDADDYRGVEINNYMERFVKNDKKKPLPTGVKNPYGYYDIREIFEKKSADLDNDEELFRYGDTKDTDREDVVHLSAKGILFLQEILIDKIRGHLQEYPAAYESLRKDDDQFIRKRLDQNEDGIDRNHFKVTNWKPAMSSDIEDIDQQLTSHQTRDSVPEKKQESCYKPTIDKPLTEYEREKKKLQPKHVNEYTSTLKNTSSFKTNSHSPKVLKPQKYNSPKVHSPKVQEYKKVKVEIESYTPSEPRNLLIPSRRNGPRKRPRNEENDREIITEKGAWATRDDKQVFETRDSAYKPTINAYTPTING